MATGKRSRKELDGRPLHGYGVMMESDYNLSTTVDTAFTCLVFGPIVTFVGFAILVSDDPSVTQYWYFGLVALVVGILGVIWGVAITERGIRRRRALREAEQAANRAADDGAPVRQITIRPRRRY